MYICPKCHKTSFTVGMCTMTDMYFPPRYENIDGKVVNTNPDRNSNTCKIHCTCGNEEYVEQNPNCSGYIDLFN